MDIDNSDLITEWNLVGLPVPIIQTLNKKNNKGYLVWLLKTPVYKEHQHATDYYKAIVNSIKKLIGADIAYQNHQTKDFLNTKLYRVTYNDVAHDCNNHGRYETRIVEVYDDLYLIEDDWDIAKSIVTVTSEVIIGDKIANETRYYIQI